jgi:hypothetical protein
MVDKEKDRLDELSKDIGKLIESNRKLVSRIMDEDFPAEEEVVQAQDVDEGEEDFEEL